MNYELAKKLKDAGFPIQTMEKVFEKGGVWGKIDDEDYGYPTLSELIEACGLYFKRVSQEISVIDGKTVGFWSAHRYLSEGEIEYHQYTGESPEEAVANLYLKLHEKEN